jgi:hypothetical protein
VRRPQRLNQENLLRERSGGLSDDYAEGLGVTHREVSQHATVNFDTGFVQTVNEAAVAQTMFADTGVDALDPKSPHVTLAGTTVTECIDTGMLDCLVRRTKGTTTVAVVTLGLFKYCLVVLLGVYASFYSCHFKSFLIFLKSEHPLDVFFDTGSDV